VVTAEPKPQDTAERPQVTVMFSDLVGSTALSARMDPEARYRKREPQIILKTARQAGRMNP
jgi:hypothetical protein